MCSMEMLLISVAQIENLLKCTWRLIAAYLINFTRRNVPSALTSHYTFLYHRHHHGGRTPACRKRFLELYYWTGFASRSRLFMRHFWFIDYAEETLPLSLSSGWTPTPTVFMRPHYHNFIRKYQLMFSVLIWTAIIKDLFWITAIRLLIYARL